MSCTNLGVAPQLVDVFRCSVEMSAGGAVVAAIVMFGLMMYGMYKARIPFIVQVPIGLVVLYVFAGAGAGNAQVGGVGAFSTLMWISIIAIAAATIFAFWRLRRQ